MICIAYVLEKAGFSYASENGILRAAIVYVSG